MACQPGADFDPLVGHIIVEINVYDLVGGQCGIDGVEEPDNS